MDRHRAGRACGLRSRAAPRFAEAVPCLHLDGPQQRPGRHEVHQHDRGRSPFVRGVGECLLPVAGPRRRCSVSAERLSASRFRRTLAWFICPRPRGVVAAAIQYGHLHVQITQGYSGSYALGFPDYIAFERWLARLDELDEADRRLNEGGDVSGPAADAYRSRVAGGASRFAAAHPQPHNVEIGDITIRPTVQN